MNFAASSILYDLSKRFSNGKFALDIVSYKSGACW